MSEKLDRPDSWLSVTILDLGITITGSTPPTENRHYYGGNIPFYKPTDLNKGLVDTSSDNLTENGANVARILPANCVLVTCIGATIGKTGLIKKEGAFNQQINGIHHFIIEAKFIYYQIIESRFQKQIRDSASSTTLPILNKSKFEKLNFKLAPLNEQYRIVAKIEELFSELDNGIENLKQAQQQLKVYRQALLKYAFEGKLSGKEIKEDNLPEGWKRVNLKEICKIAGGVTKGKDFKGKETIHLPYLRVANVQDGYLDLKEIKTIEVLPSDKEKYQLLYGDILYTEGGDKDKLGRGTIWKNEVQDCIHQNHIFRARPITEEIESKYIAYFSQTKAAKDYFFKWAKQTTNLASINITVLSTLPIPICSINEQRQIVQYLESQFSIIDNLEKTIIQSLQESAALRQSILKKAFEGKLAAQDPEDEPASELLKRIQADKVKYLEEQKANKKLSHKTPKVMAKQEQSVLEVLQASAEPLLAEEVWKQSKHRGDIEAFYAELKTIEGKIKEVKKGTEAFLSLADAD